VDIKNALMQCNIQIDYLDNVFNAKDWIGVGVGIGGTGTGSDVHTTTTEMHNNVKEEDKPDLLRARRLLLAENKGV
jgi:hypothetical protein